MVAVSEWDILPSELVNGLITRNIQSHRCAAQMAVNNLGVTATVQISCHKYTVPC